MSCRIIRYVVRTGEEVILNKKPDSGIFVGVIYLEKMYQDGFDENTVSIIKSFLFHLYQKNNYKGCVTFIIYLIQGK